MKCQDQVKSPTHLNASHQRTFEAIFRHLTSHNLEWHDVRSLLAALADVAEEHDGTLRVTHNGQSTILHVPKHKDVATVEDVLALRHFLDQSGEIAIPAAGVQLLVMIDHHEAKIYRTLLHGAVPNQLVPSDPPRLRTAPSVREPRDRRQTRARANKVGDTVSPFG